MNERSSGAFGIFSAFLAVDDSLESVVGQVKAKLARVQENVSLYADKIVEYAEILDRVVVRFS